MFKHYYVKILLFTVLLMAMPLAVTAESAEEYQENLDLIRDKISGVLSALGENKDKRDSVRTELKKLEIKIAKASKDLRNTQRKYTKSDKNLKKTRSELKKLKKNLNKQREILASQVRSAYVMGQQPQLKMLLNQQDPSEMGRAMVYYTYLNQARGKEIENFIVSIEKEKTLEATVKEVSKELKVLLDERRSSKNKLSRHRNNRKNLLAKLEKDINNQQITLDGLESSRGRIEILLESLGELLADIPAEPLNQKPFGDLKGKLPWPIKGKLSASFGSTRHQGDLKWNGVVIRADYDTPIRAVSNGRIAFADWLQGYGFITIIDHNDGYMSLYGYSQELYKQVGDWVEAGEVIASVGDSGGQLDSGLYFEIRKQGKPINPKKWCSTSVRHVALQDN